MSKLSTQEVTSAKAILGVVPAADNSKLIDCPAHPGQHKATMSVWPSDAAGYWECPKGLSDMHDCMESAGEGKSELEIETTEVPSLGADGEYQGYDRSFYVCAGDEGCGRATDLDVADPQDQGEY